METETVSQRYSGLDAWEPSEILDALIEGQLAAVAAVRGARSAMEAARDRDRGAAPNRQRTPDLCRRRHLGPARGPGRRRAAADLQLAAGAPPPPHRRRRRGPRPFGRRRRGRIRARRRNHPPARGRRARRPARRCGERHDAFHACLPDRGAGARGAHGRDRQQPGHAAPDAGRSRHLARYRSGSDRRLDPNEGRHRPEDHPEPPVLARHDPDGTGLRRPHGRRAGDEREARPAQRERC